MVAGCLGDREMTIDQYLTSFDLDLIGMEAELEQSLMRRSASVSGDEIDLEIPLLVELEVLRARGQ